MKHEKEEIKAELERLRRIIPGQYDTVISWAVRQRIADLEQKLKELKNDDHK
jgi:hypothetical protein